MTAAAAPMMTMVDINPKPAPSLTSSGVSCPRVGL